jgi:hypothetical protein
MGAVAWSRLANAPFPIPAHRTDVPISGIRLSDYGPSDRSAAKGDLCHGYPDEPLVSFRTYRQLSGWNPPPRVFAPSGRTATNGPFRGSRDSPREPGKSHWPARAHAVGLGSRALQKPGGLTSTHVGSRPCRRLLPRGLGVSLSRPVLPPGFHPPMNLHCIASFTAGAGWPSKQHQRCWVPKAKPRL